MSFKSQKNIYLQIVKYMCVCMYAQVYVCVPVFVHMSAPICGMCRQWENLRHCFQSPPTILFETRFVTNLKFTKWSMVAGQEPQPYPHPCLPMVGLQGYAFSPGFLSMSSWDQTVAPH